MQIDYDVSGKVTIFNEFDGSNTEISGTDVITFFYPTKPSGSYSISISAAAKTGEKQFKNFVKILFKL